MVRRHGPEKFCKITSKNNHFRTSQIGSFSKIKKAFAYASKSRANPEYSRKASFAFAKTAWFCFKVFLFLGSEGEPWHSGLFLGTLVAVFILLTCLKSLSQLLLLFHSLECNLEPKIAYLRSSLLYGLIFFFFEFK